MSFLCIDETNSIPEYRQDLREIYGSIKTFRSVELNLNNRVHLLDIGLGDSLKEICGKISSIKEKVDLDLIKTKKATCLGIDTNTQKIFNRVFSSLDTGSLISGIGLELFDSGVTHKLVILMVVVGHCFSKINDYVSASLRDLQVKRSELASIQMICSDLERYSSDLLSIHYESSDQIDGQKSEIDQSNMLRNRWKDTFGKLLDVIKKTPDNYDENSDDYDTHL